MCCPHHREQRGVGVGAHRAAPEVQAHWEAQVALEAQVAGRAAILVLERRVAWLAQAPFPAVVCTVGAEVGMVGELLSR